MIYFEILPIHVKQVMEAGIKDYSQLFPQVKNVVADALSWDNEQSDDKLTHILTSLDFPEKLPKFCCPTKLAHG